MTATDELYAKAADVMLLGQLAAMGIRADECPFPDKRTLVHVATGKHLGTFTGREAWDWIRAQENKA